MRIAETVARSQNPRTLDLGHGERGRDVTRTAAAVTGEDLYEVEPDPALGDGGRGCRTEAAVCDSHAMRDGKLSHVKSSAYQSESLKSQGRGVC